MANPTPPTPTPASPPADAIPVSVGVRHKAFEASLEFFLSPIRPFMADPLVTEIMVNGPDAIYIEKRGQLQLTTAKFGSEADVQAAANNIAQFVGQSISQERPVLDGRLPDGSRVCIVLSPLAVTGTQINIRRFGTMTVTPQFLLENKAITPLAMEFLLLAVRGYRNIVISGGAGSGKTTMVNVLTAGFGERERIVVIEDTRELQ
ncbi:MAG: ATPase, T2SS/T4P/T4SS family, partial [Tepidisphaeraceae bacterium]